MPAPAQVADLVEQMPRPGRHLGSDEQTKAQAEKIIGQLAGGGRESALALVELLRTPEQGGDEKARYALHALGVHLTAGDDATRRQFSAALASALESDRPPEVKKFLIRELQTAGGPEVAPALGNLLTDPALYEPAAQALLAIRDGAAEQFRAALPESSGPARLTIIQALGVLRDDESAAELKKLVDDEDREVRLAAAWGLANIPDRTAVDLLLKAAATEDDRYERIGATKICLLLAENLLAAGHDADATRIYRHLRDTRRDPSERYVREAAEEALAAGP